jgi:glycosyltransferase involved in cell wall biosynthesis
MRISAIMAAYNAGPYIAEALDSMLSQTRPADEIIVVDDGSTDETAEVLRRYAARVTVLSQQNSGPAHALNVGVSAAQGDAFAFLDADDLWVPEKLEIQVAALCSDPALEAVFGAIQQFVSPELDAATARTFAIPDAPQPGISKTAMLIHRCAFLRIGPFDERQTAADFVDWYARASGLGLRFRVLPQVVTWRRQHRDNLGRRRRADQHDELLQSLKRALDLRRANRKPGSST